MIAVALAAVAAVGVHYLYTAYAYGWDGLRPGPPRSRVDRTSRARQWLTQAGLVDLDPREFAAVSSVGGFMIPEMNRKGYNREFNVSVTTTAATTGLMIPPSNIMIVYSVAAGSVSIAAMFMAGVLPGILTGFFIIRR